MSDTWPKSNLKEKSMKGPEFGVSVEDFLVKSKKEAQKRSNFKVIAGGLVEKTGPGQKKIDKIVLPRYWKLAPDSSVRTDTAENDDSLNDDGPTLAKDIEELTDRARREAPELVALLTLAAQLAKPDRVRLPDPPERLAEHELAEFRQHAKSHPWSTAAGLSPSQFIKRHYASWLGKKDDEGNWVGRALWREDIAKVAGETKLVAAYATEIGRHPERAVAGLYTKPHKLPIGATPSSSQEVGILRLPTYSLSEEQLAERRKVGREYIRRYRSQRKPS